MINEAIPAITMRSIHLITARPVSILANRLS
jgi:hypothetical protein